MPHSLRERLTSPAGVSIRCTGRWALPYVCLRHCRRSRYACHLHPPCGRL